MKLFLKIYHLNYNFNIENNGKLNKDFYHSFKLELIRDYLIFNTSCEIPDMQLLRHLTKPRLDANNPYIPNFKLGCGDIDIDIINNYLLKYSEINRENFNIYIELYGPIKFILYSNNHLF